MKKISLLLFILTICLAVTIPSYAKRLKGCDYVSYHSPCWMPDSKHIVYIKHISHHKYRYGWLAAVSKSGDLWVGNDYYIYKMNVETKKEEIIKKYFSKVDQIKSKYEYFVDENGKAKRFPYKMESFKIDCSKDGKWICFNSGTLHLLSADGKILKKLPVAGGIPKFSPDGKRILYGVSSDVRTHEGKYVCKKDDLRLIDVDGENDRLLVENATHGIWHPSGEKIGYHREKDKIDFWTVNVDGTNKKAEFKANCYPCDWSPDGGYINTVGRFLDMQGKRMKTGFKSIPSYGKFSPDGLKMVGESLGITFSKIGDEKETVLLKDYSKEY
ncbi:MAG: hypothetical protein Q7J67_01375 [bacterium]|nr:hypothetical protein [bacterium]